MFILRKERRGKKCGVSASTDYAIRMMICLADAAGPVSSSKLARMIGVSTRYLLQIGARLRDAGMITVTYGSSGGYKLSFTAGRNLFIGHYYADGAESRANCFPLRRSNRNGISAFGANISGSWKSVFRTTP